MTPAWVTAARIVAAASATVAIAAGCGSGSAKPVDGTGSTSTTTTTVVADPTRTATGTATTHDGRYRITLSVGRPGPGAPVVACAPATPAGTSALPVSVIVANDDPGRAVTFPALRVELVGGGPPTPVPVRNSSGACSFTPHETALEAAASVVLPGATPAISDSAPAGSAGRVEVAISENDFSIGVPVP